MRSIGYIVILVIHIIIIINLLLLLLLQTRSFPGSSAKTIAATEPTIGTQIALGP